MCLPKCKTISCQEGLVKVFCTVWHNSTQQFQSNLHHFKKPIYVGVKQSFFLHYRRWDIQVDRLKTVFVKIFFHLQKCIISLLYVNDSKVFHSILTGFHSNSPSLLPYVQPSLSSNDIVVIPVVKVLEGQYQKRYSDWKICYVFLELPITGDLMTLNINVET